MSRDAQVGSEVIDQFAAWEIDGVTKRSGLTVFGVTVWRDGVVQTTPVAIAEIGSSGEYRVSFTPDVIGYWEIEVVVPDLDDIWALRCEVADVPPLTFGMVVSEGATEIAIGIWTTRAGARYTPDSMEAIVRAANGSLVYDLGATAVHSAEGVFRFTMPRAALPATAAYYVDVAATVGARSWSGTLGMAKI